MIFELIDSVFTVYMIMLFIRIISSWFPEYRNHKIMLFIAYYTDPYLNIFRKFIPPLGMIDFSPIIAFFFLQVIQTIVKMVISTWV